MPQVITAEEFRRLSKNKIGRARINKVGRDFMNKGGAKDFRFTTSNLFSIGQTVWVLIVGDPVKMMITAWDEPSKQFRLEYLDDSPGCFYMNEADLLRHQEYKREYEKTE